MWLIYLISVILSFAVIFTLYRKHEDITIGILTIMTIVCLFPVVNLLTMFFLVHVVMEINEVYSKPLFKKTGKK